jgi:hypothetical protein
MSYYGQGDYFPRGGYYRGDPGFFSFLGGVAKKAVGLIPGVGPALSAGIEMATRKAAPKLLPEAGTLAARGGMASKITGIIKSHPVISAAGAAGVGGLASGVAGAVAARALRGKHLFGVGGRRRRRMNPCNPRALRRAIRRAHAFERLAKHVIGFSSPRKPKGHMYFKRKRKSR